MAEHNELGKEGEELAKKHLLEKGYEIVVSNWRFGKDEIDIIANDGEYIVFVEVKTRKTNYFGEPETFVTNTKQKFMIRAAQVYITQREIDREARFDIVAVLFCQKKVQIHHIEDAFYPTL